MGHAAAGACLLLVMLAVAGCADDDEPSDDPVVPETVLCPTPTGPGAAPGEPAPMALPMRARFEEPAQVRDAQPFPPHATDGAWSVKADADAPEGSNVVFGQGDGDPGFSALLFPAAGDHTDLDLRMTFSIGCVQHPHGVGAVLHVADADDYQIIRYSASESSWDFFTVRGGERTRQDAARVGEGTDSEPGAWVDLRVTSQAGRVQAFDGATRVLDFTLAPEDAATGQAGLFLRGGSDARFDDVRLDAGGMPA